MNEQQLARGLGWFSIGLGLAEVIAPQRLARAIGVRESAKKVLPWLGVRKLTSGIGILTQQQQAAPWLWSRVAGDALDLSLLAKALSGERWPRERRRIMTAMAAVLGVTVLDLYCSVRASETSHRNGRNGSSNGYSRNGGDSRNAEGKSSEKVVKCVTINRPAEEIYNFWRQLENLPKFMNHLIAVTESGEGRSHWVAKGPAGSQVEWDAEIVEETPHQLIAWRSLPGAQVENSGRVTLEPATGMRGTVVRVDLQYRPPGGAVGATIAKLFGEAPEKQIPVDLRRIKQLLETGEIARTEGQSSGRPTSTSPRYDDFVRS